VLLSFSLTSALAKLVVHEVESAALHQWANACGDTLITNDLARTELMRAVRRIAPDFALAARHVLDAVGITTMRTELFEIAGRLDPPSLRSLDALHLAAALDFGDELAGFVTYDERLAHSAELFGIHVLAPR